MLWIFKLYRFGYDLTMISDTKENGIKALKKEYYDTHKKYNDGCRPTKEEWQLALEETYIDEIKLNHVMWL